MSSMSRCNLAILVGINFIIGNISIYLFAIAAKVYPMFFGSH